MNRVSVEQERAIMQQIMDENKVIIIKVVDPSWKDVKSPLMDLPIHNCLSVFDVGCNMDEDRQIIVFDEPNYKLVTIDDVADIAYNRQQELCAIYTDHLIYVCGYAKKWLPKTDESQMKNGGV